MARSMPGAPAQDGVKVFTAPPTHTRAHRPVAPRPTRDTVTADSTPATKEGPGER